VFSAVVFVFADGVLCLFLFLFFFQLVFRVLFCCFCFLQLVFVFSSVVFVFAVGTLWFFLFFCFFS